MHIILLHNDYNLHLKIDKNVFQLKLSIGI